MYVGPEFILTGFLAVLYAQKHNLELKKPRA